MDVSFLYAPQKLVKTISMMANGEVRKSAYPHAKNFTNETVEVDSLLDFYKALAGRATDPRKPCLIKGRLNRPLIGESRRNSTSTNDKTQFIVLDPDEAPFSSPDELMRAIGLGDVSYVVQYSSSYKLSKSKKLSAHIFILLDRPLPATTLKAWLMQLNLDVPVLKSALTLSNSQCALKWTLDITSCQNDRLIYIAEPEFQGMKSPVKASERILIVKKERERLDVSRVSERSMDGLKKEARAELNRLQVAAGITPLKTKPRIVGEFLVQHGVSEVGNYEVVDADDEFVRLNLNGGDSAAYWHYRDDFELLHNFKGEDSVKLKEILPEYYKDLVNSKKDAERKTKALAAAQNESPSEDGDVILCFRDKRTGSYWNGTFNNTTRKLDLFTARNERQCGDFMLSHGKDVGDYIPIWERVFDPTTDVIVDHEARTINMWVPSEYMKNATRSKEPNLNKCPLIKRILDSAVGEGQIQEHFLNWLAVVVQYRTKPRTAWVFHGTQGTGKGLLVNKILAPMLNPQYVMVRLQNELKSEFSAFLEFALIAFIDEIEVDSLQEGGAVESKLKYYITEPTVPIRRMRTDSYSVPSFTGWLFGSNKNQPVIIPRNDRRYNVAKFQKEKIDLTQDQIETQLPLEIQAFTDYLISRRADKNIAATPLLTEDRATLMALSETSVDRTAQAIMAGDLEALWDAMPDQGNIEALHSNSSYAMVATAYINFMKRACEDAFHNRPSRISRDELGAIFEHCVGGVPRSANKLTTYLAHHGIHLTRMRSSHTGERINGYDIEWHIERASLLEIYTPPKPQPRARKNTGTLNIVKG